MFLSVGGISMYREKVVGDQWMPVIINLYLPREAGESTNREVFSIYHRYSIWQPTEEARDTDYDFRAFIICWDEEIADPKLNRSGNLEMFCVLIRFYLCQDLFLGSVLTTS